MESMQQILGMACHIMNYSDFMLFVEDKDQVLHVMNLLGEDWKKKLIEACCLLYHGFCFKPPYRV